MIIEVVVPKEIDNVENWKSIFLAGPTPRDKSVESWRPEFIDKLLDKEKNIIVYNPESYGLKPKNYIEQCEWEYKHLNKASAIIFWIPRNLETLPGFTTNVEFGYWVNSDKVFYGRPEGSPKTKYLDWLYKKKHCDPCKSMDELIEEALSYLGV